MDYKGKCSTQGVEFDVQFSVENNNVSNFKPEGLGERLHGDALLAHVNYQNLIRGILRQLPTRIKDVYRAPEEIDIPTDISMPGQNV